MPLYDPFPVTNYATVRDVAELGELPLVGLALLWILVTGLLRSCGLTRWARLLAGRNLPIVVKASVLRS